MLRVMLRVADFYSLGAGVSRFAPRFGAEYVRVGPATKDPGREAYNLRWDDLSRREPRLPTMAGNDKQIKAKIDLDRGRIVGSGRCSLLMAKKAAQR